MTETTERGIAGACTVACRLDQEFSAVLQKSPKPGGWTYVVMPGSADLFGTRGLVKVRGTVDGHAFESAFGPRRRHAQAADQGGRLPGDRQARR